MYCTCSNKNKYEVIYSCDVKKFTHKNVHFNNKSWAQISITDVSTLNCPDTNIEKIDKVYVNIDIVFSKIIYTPTIITPNLEGMTLTVKKFLIDGFICSKIVHTSLTGEQCVYTCDFTIPSCTYIVLEINTDPFNDNCFIKTCIEDVFLSLVDCKTIFQNVTDINGGADYFKFTLYQSNGTTEKITNSIGGNESGMNFSNDVSNTSFQEDDIINLQAQSHNKVIITNFPTATTPIYTPKGNEISFKISRNGLLPYTPPVTIPNEIVFTKVDNTEIAKISFNTNNTLTVTSTSNQFNDSENRAMVLFKLRDGTNLNTIKVHSLIASNINASKLVADLNNAGFSLNDVIEITIYTPKTAKITNFSTQGRTYIIDDRISADHTLTEFFKITSSGLQSTAPSPLPLTAQLLNIISIRSRFAPNRLIFSIVFNTLDKILFIQSTNDFSIQNQFLNVKLLDANGTTVIEVPFQGGTRADSYKLATVFFDFGYILELTYSDVYKPFIEISNFPTQGQTHIPTVNKEMFRITQTGLEAIAPPATILPNEVLITNAANNEIAKISFDVTNNKLLVTSTGEQIANPDNRAMILLYLRDGSTGAIKSNSLIASNKNASQFVTDLNEKDFALNDFIELNVYSAGTAKISNFPDTGNIYTIDTTTDKVKTSQEFFQITSTKLEKINPQGSPTPPRLPQDLDYRLASGTGVFQLYFNTLNQVITLNRTPSSSSVGTLKIKLIDLNGAIIFEKTNNDTTTFLYKISNLFFDYEQILQLNYDDSSRSNIYISNFPTQGETHRPTTNEEFYKITQTGLESYTPPITTLPNEIIIKKTDNSTFGTIIFDITNNKLILTGFNGEYSSGGDDYNVLNFRLYATNDSRTKNVTLNSLSNSNNFLNELKGASFNINSVLELSYDDRSKSSINVTNFPNSPNIHTPTVVREYYKITAQGLEPHIPIPDTIKYFKNDGSLSYIINLDLVQKVCSANIINRDKNTDTSSFTLKLNGDISAEISIGSDFFISRNAVGGKFDYNNSTISFDFPDNTVVLVNYPTLGATYTVPETLFNVEQRLTINGIKT